MVLASGNSSENNSGASVTVFNSIFDANEAGSDNGGVFNVNQFSEVIIAGDGNFFTRNICAVDGAVLAASSDTNVIVEGGKFHDNLGQLVSFGVVRLKCRFKMCLKRKGEGLAAFSCGGETLG